MTQEEAEIIWNEKHPEEHLAGQEPRRIDPLTWFGTHEGIASKRVFYYETTTLEIEKLSLGGVRFNSEGVENVRTHLSRFGQDQLNESMLERLDKIVVGELQATSFDVRFYTHEMREACRYSSRGWDHGVPLDEDERHQLWNTEHTCALEEFGVHERRFPLFHPDAIGGFE